MIYVDSLSKQNPHGGNHGGFIVLTIILTIALFKLQLLYNMSNIFSSYPISGLGFFSSSN